MLYSPRAATNGIWNPDAELCERIKAEYVEMPGMRLTLTQAARLFNLEQVRCARVLRSLVEEGALAASDGTFFLSAGGRA